VKILILGGNRFVGKQLSQELLVNTAWDYELYTKLPGINKVDVFNRSGTGISNVNKIQGDRNNKEDLKKIDFGKYDSIVDMCLYKVEQFNLIKNLIPKNTNYVFVSSGAVDYQKDFGDYASEKIEVENALIKSKINYKIVRPSYIVGKGDPHSRLESYITPSVPVDGGQRGAMSVINLVFVQDVVNCLVKLSEDLSRTNEIYYICGKNYKIKELLFKLTHSLRQYNSKYKMKFGKAAPRLEYLENNPIYTIIGNSNNPPFKNFPFKFTHSQRTKITDHYGVSISNFTDRIREYIETTMGPPK
tara:strand:- start:359 stop:1264 length:906 start_codon:yes stop_codon:yes gene_type:complete